MRQTHAQTLVAILLLWGLAAPTRLLLQHDDGTLRRLQQPQYSMTWVCAAGGVQQGGAVAVGRHPDRPAQGGAQPPAEGARRMPLAHASRAHRVVFAGWQVGRKRYLSCFHLQLCIYSVKTQAVRKWGGGVQELACLAL